MDSIVLPRMHLFGECITRTCTIKAIQKGAINLSQGFPEDDPVVSVRESACSAIMHGRNQYADMRGDPSLRRALAERYKAIPAMEWIAPDLHVTVTCGATEAMAAAVMATAGVGDEIIIQEPTYENYPSQALLAGANIRYLSSSPPDWRITEEKLDNVFNKNTKVLIINNPNNPTGRVYSIEELSLVAEFCIKYNVIVLVDEIYENLVWDKREMIHLATLDGMSERTITISGISKTYAATGWRVGWAIAPENMTLALRRIHDFMTATVPTPFQLASVQALNLPVDYYDDLINKYELRRQLLSSYLEEAGLIFQIPEGAYYFFPSCELLAFQNSIEFFDKMIEEAKVAVVPYNAFYKQKKGQYRFRINFAKKEETLEEAGRRIVLFCKKYKK